MRLINFMCFFFLSLGSLTALAQVQAADGVLDLRGKSLESPRDLGGSWDFYWQTFVDPDQLSAHASDRTQTPVPSLWTNVKEKYPTFGYATYHLKVLLDKPQAVALYFPASIWSAYRIFVDGETVVQYGKIGTSAETSSGGQGSKVYAFTPKRADFDIVVQVANFEIFLAGMNVAPMIGTLDSIVMLRYEKLSMDIFIIGALFIMGIYHLCLFSLRRSDPSTIFFGLMCLGVGSYLTVTRDGVLMTLWPDLDFGLRLRVYNVAWISSIPMFAWFAYFSFREHYTRWVPSVSVRLRWFS